MSLHIHVDTDPVDRELNRLAAGPTPVDIRRFSAVLTAQFQHTQQRVHIITGSLRASGKEDAGETEHGWEGQISYGGPAPGFRHDPVKYADEERGRQGRGYPGTNIAGDTNSNHDFMAPVFNAGYNRQYIQAMLDFLRDA